MCGERWLRRHREREADEAREMWAEFERATPLSDPEPPAERPEPERAEAREEMETADL